MKYIAKISILLFVVSCLFTTPPSFTDETIPIKARDISNEEYFPATLDIINNAKESVVVAMYYIGYNPANKDSKPNQLVQALINAHKRGCKVKVYLDRTGDIEDVADDAVRDDEVLRKTKNVEVQAVLEDVGIEVVGSFDVVLNSKVVVVDREIVISGSANWSDDGLGENLESNMLIVSKEYAESNLSKLQTLES